MKNQKDIATRVYIVFATLCLLGLAIVVKILVIQFGAGESWQERADDFVFVKEIKPSRGQILARDGSLLATSVPEFDIYWDSRSEAIDKAFFAASLDSLCIAFSKLFGDKSKSEYKAMFLEAQSRGDRYKLIARDVDYNEQKAIQQFPFIRRGRYKSGFIFQRTDKRMKPFGKLAARTIGIDRDDYRVGLEGAFHNELAGRPGKRIEQRIPGGFSKPLSDEYIIEPQEGCDLLTTIDVHIQDVAAQALEKQMVQHHAQWGTVIVMEVQTGYIRAISNLELDGESGRYEEALNYAVGHAIEPGSTFKLASLVATLDEGLASLQDTVDTYEGRTTFYGMPMHDSDYDKGKGHGVINVEECFELSSNIGTAKTIHKAFRNDPQRFLDKLWAMGLGEPLGLSIKGEAIPALRKQVGEKGWSGVSPTQMAIGYEVTQTPLQTLAFYNAFANDGRLVQPLFASHLVQNGKVVQEFSPNVLQDEICSKRTLKLARQMLEGVVETGTGKDAFANSPYTVAGKTGTARVTRNGKYVQSRYRASFCGYFPAEKPRYSILVLISEPSSGIYYASSLAAPVFREIADKIFATEFELHQNESPTLVADGHLPVSKDGSGPELLSVYKELGIPVSLQGQGDWVRVSTGKDSVSIKQVEFPKGLVPNVVGMGLQDALYLLENAGLKVKVQGFGTVKKQSVPTGARVNHHSHITIELS